MKRVFSWIGYAGIAVLAAGAIASLSGRPDWYAVRWWVAGAGVLLVLVSLLGHIEDLRGLAARRTMRYGLNTAVMIVLLLAVIGFVEAMSYRHNARVDLTENKRHSLSPQTVQLLRGLKSEVKATAFFRPDQPNKKDAETLLSQYAKFSNGKFAWQPADPDLVPTLARKYGVEAYGTIVLEAGGKTEKVNDAEEEKLTNGLLKVTREGTRTVYTVQGHGENDLANTDRLGLSEAKTALEQANYQVKPLVLAREGKVPDDAAVVIVAGPRTDFLAPEIEALDGYLAKSGKLLAMLNPTLRPTEREPEGLKKLLGKYGLEVGTNLVIEPNPLKQMFTGGPEIVVVDQYEDHAITREVRVITLFPVTRTVGPPKTPVTGMTVQALAKTSPDSWGETDFKSLAGGQVRKDAADPAGPLPVAAVATRDKTRVVAFGTSLLAANEYIRLQGNRDFFLNTVSWLAEQEDQISIRPKDAKQAPVFLSSQQETFVRVMSLVVVPGLFLVAGIVAVVRRRST